MAARKDSPEMFEAFKFANDDRKRRGQGDSEPAGEQPAPVEPKPPVEPARKEEMPPMSPLAPKAPAATTPTTPKEQREPIVSRPAPSVRPDRPWNQANKTPDPAFYLPLGKQRQIVLSMSYMVAGIGGALLVGVMMVAFVLGMWAGGPEAEQSAAGYTGKTETVPAAEGVVYRVQVVTVNNSEVGRAALNEMQAALESHGYKDIAQKSTSNQTKLCMLVGRFSYDAPGNEAAKALVARVSQEQFKGMRPFAKAFVVHGK